MKTGNLNPSGFSLRSVRRFFLNFISIFIIKESEKKRKFQMEPQYRPTYIVFMSLMNWCGKKVQNVI